MIGAFSGNASGTLPCWKKQTVETVHFLRFYNSKNVVLRGGSKQINDYIILIKRFFRSFSNFVFV